MLGNAESKVISQKNASAVINLGETFGTVKKKKQIKEVERNKVSADSLAAVDNILMKQIDSTPGETKAKSPEDVYNIEDIAPSTDLRQVPQSSPAGIKEILPDVTGWVFEQVRSMSYGEVEKQNLVYLSYMIRFFKATEHVLNKRDQAQKYFEHVPAAILETFTQKFTEQLVEQNPQIHHLYALQIPERVHDKLMAYILALALKIEGYKMDVNGMAAVLGVPVTKVGSMCRELGCRVESVKADGGTERKAVLSVPLKFPTRSLY
ncbi:RNA polymerase I associated factor, A49-like protein [Chytridium lagenaria]|nr:RNA polymerase I associated factor, A49-like protein [Chytridium lagenaria]